MIQRFIYCLIFLITANSIKAQITYPYTLDTISLPVENKKVSMAYMDVKPANPNGKTILLFHGKNFNGYYWKDIIPWLAGKGFRVIVPDQLGWGRSDKVDLHYSFHLLAKNNQTLLDALSIKKVIALGHSMGGMLAIRFSLLYPQLVEKLILENPIGLEDYKTFVPYQTLEKIYEKERSATYESYKKYQQSYYPEWKPEYEQYVKAQAESLNDIDFAKIAWVNALTYQMIYEQPIVYEVQQITVPTLLIIGQKDRTIVGKDLLTDEQKNKHGLYPFLGRKISRLIPHAKLVELKYAGHIPHIQSPAAFKKIVEDFL